MFHGENVWMPLRLDKNKWMKKIQEHQKNKSNFKVSWKKCVDVIKVRWEQMIEKKCRCQCDG